MALNKIANYNIRFCDVIDHENMKINLTPAEVKESNGKVIYVLRLIGIDTWDFGYFNDYDVIDSSISFIYNTAEGVKLLVLQAVSDTDFYHIVD